MNYAESFEEFSRSVKPTDLALYAGVGVVLWVLFKDKLSPVQKVLLDVFNQAKSLVLSLTKSSPKKEVVLSGVAKDDLFLELLGSWKHTRDLAVKYGCDEAVKNLDQIFPSLSPQSCQKTGV